MWGVGSSGSSDRRVTILRVWGFERNRGVIMKRSLIAVA